VPAVIAYNFFVRRVTRFDTEMATSASDLLDALYSKSDADEGGSAVPAHLRPGRA
jgi:biopolymer transport protein ExbB/TolQ